MQVKKALKQNEKAAFLCVLREYIDDTTDAHLSMITPTTTTTSPNDSRTERISKYVNHLLNDQFRAITCDGNPTFPESRGDLDHRIELIPGAKPPVGTTYRMSPKELEVLRTTLEDLLTAGFIRPSHSPYGCPILFVPKKGTDELRFCVDYRALNKLTIADKYPLPRIDEILDQLSEATIFSKIDLRLGYWQIRVRDEDVEKTAFRTKYGSFEWLVVPMGLSNAPATFQRVVNHVLRPYIDKFATVYLDDILVYSKTEDEHRAHLRLLFDALAANKLQVKPTKCRWGLAEVDYLGFCIAADGLKPDAAKVQALQEWPRPRNQTEVRGFLGLAGYFRRFIPGFAEKSHNLTDLTRDDIDVPSSWNSKHDDEMDQLKRALTTAPVLKLPDFKEPFHVLPDYSGRAIGAWLGQNDEADQTTIKRLRPIAFLSRKLTDAERDYPTYEGELLAIIQAFKDWRCYLEGSRVIVHSDHRGLQWLLAQKVLNRRQARWVELLQGYQHACFVPPTATNDGHWEPGIDIRYLPGEENTIADLLSRRYDYADEEITKNEIKIDHISLTTNDLLERIRHMTNADPLLNELKTFAIDDDKQKKPHVERYLRRWYYDDGIF